MAAGSRAARAGARRAGGPPRPASVHDGDHRRRRARKCASPESASGSIAERASAWERWYGPVAAARWGSAAVAYAGLGRFSAPPTSARSCSSRSGSRAARQTCCWCWPPDRGSRRTSARRSARSVSCAASGWMARSVWRGSRTTSRRSRRPPICPVPTSLQRGHPLRSRVVRLSRHRRGSCSTMCR